MAKVKKQLDEAPQPYLIGYARVSTKDQNLDMQKDALRAAGVREDNLHVEKVGATAKRRPMLDNAIKDLRPGDTFLVWRLDRLARNIRDLFKRLEEIEEAGAKFKSLTEHFDTDTAAGRLQMHVIAAMAEFERQLIQDRTKAGMAHLKKKGKRLGAELKMTEERKARITKLMLSTKLTIKEIAAKEGIAVSSIHGHFPGGRSAVLKKAARKAKQGK